MHWPLPRHLLLQHQGAASSAVLLSAAAYEEAMQLMKAAEAESQAKHEQLMAQIDRERAARRAALWSFRLPPPFSPEVAAALKEARELLDQMMQEQERAAAEEQRQKVEQQKQARAAAAEERRKARAAAEEQRQKADARRAALLERKSAVLRWHWLLEGRAGSTCLVRVLVCCRMLTQPA
jgi:NADH dehydrogenase/NADH:ubiquinone oxidoreductase subunit G